jgi:hypothetical protein
MWFFLITVLFIPSASGFTAVGSHGQNERSATNSKTSAGGEPEDMELPPADELSDPNAPTPTSLASQPKRIIATLLLGVLVATPPAINFAVGVSRRASLAKLDKERGKRVKEFAKPFVKSQSTGTMWPSEYNGPIKGTIEHPFMGISDEGTLLHYSASQVTTIYGTFADKDGVFFSYNLNLRLITNIFIGIGTAVISQLVFAHVAESKETEGKAEVWEVDHVFEQLGSINSVLEPALALFLSFYVSFMIGRNREYGVCAIGGLWAGLVNYNIVLAAELPEAKYDRLRQTALRYTMAIWEDVFDSIRMSGDEYCEGKGMDQLEERGLLLPDECAHVKKACGGRSTHAQPLCVWLMSMTRELYKRNAITDANHQLLHGFAAQIRGGVAYSTGLPGLQYPYLASQFLNVIVNGVTIIDAIKQGLELGESMQLMKNASWTMFNSDVAPPALCLILTPLFFYGALELGAKLDNPLFGGYIVGKNIHGIPRHAWHQAIRDNVENYSRMSTYQLVEGSSFMKCFDDI